jgi:hypothetical protein
VLIFAVSALFIGLAWVLHIWKGIPLSSLTCDPIAIIDAPLYIGFLSQIGIFFWAASAAVCLFGAQTLSGNQNKREFKHFLFVSGLFSLFLGFDDIFLIHVQLFRYLGVSEIVVFTVYAGALLAYLVRFRTIILKTEYILLGAALLFFSVSIGFDLLFYLGLDETIFEDGAKLVGIITWLAYFFRSAGLPLSVRDG